MTGFSLEKKLQGPKVLDAIKSEAFMCNVPLDMALMSGKQEVLLK